MTNENDLNVGSVRWNYHVWLSANQFRDSGNLLFEHDSSIHAPILMNYSFACELALKSCAMQTRSNCKPSGNGIIPTASFKPASRGHDLTQVFDKLPEKARLAVSTEFNKLFERDLRAELIEFKDYFVDIRYSFESRARSWDLLGMGKLANGLLDATLEARKTIGGI